MRTAWLPVAALVLLGLGTALVFGAVLARGLFLPGVALIDLALLVFIAAAVLRVRAREDG